MKIWCPEGLVCFDQGCKQKINILYLIFFETDIFLLKHVVLFHVLKAWLSLNLGYGLNY